MFPYCTIMLLQPPEGVEEGSEAGSGSEPHPWEGETGT